MAWRSSSWVSMFLEVGTRSVFFRNSQPLRSLPCSSACGTDDGTRRARSEGV